MNFQILIVFCIKTRSILLNSNFFNHKEELEKSSVISLLDEENEQEINLNDNDITTFIKYVHRQIVTISNDNVFSLNYLANKYEVLSLIDVTKEFISDHHQELVLPILSLHQNDSIFETKLYEKIISDNLSEYIGNDQLLTLKIPAIHRILKEYKLNKKDDHKMSEKIVTFLFRCIDKFGIAASCLFEFADISSMKNDCFNRLLIDYSNSFDFHFINRSFLQNLYETQSKILRNQEQQESDITFIKSELKKLQNEKNEQQEKNNEKDRLINDLLNEVNQLKSEMAQIKKDQNQQNDKIEKLTKYNEDKINKKFHECKPYNADFDGIFNYLQTSFNIKDEVDIKHTKSSLDPYKLFDYINDRSCFQCDDYPNSWIRFEFKKYFIIPSHYIIRSYWQQNNDHLKTWVIEGSNDGDDNWDTLDEQKDCPYLNGSSYIHLFPISKKEFAGKYYKYIRIRQTGKTWANRDYLLMNAFELFGKLI